MTLLEKLNRWLSTFPLWQTPRMDGLDSKPEALGLFPTGLTVLHIREDVLGNRIARYRFTGEVKRATTEGPYWMIAFQQWLAEQDRLGLGPKLGGRETVSGGKGRKTGSDRAGTAFYTAELTVEYDDEVN